MLQLEKTKKQILKMKNDKLQRSKTNRTSVSPNIKKHHSTNIIANLFSNDKSSISDKDINNYNNIKEGNCTQRTTRKHYKNASYDENNKIRIEQERYLEDLRNKEIVNLKFNFIIINLIKARQKIKIERRVA